MNIKARDLTRNVAAWQALKAAIHTPESEPLNPEDLLPEAFAAAFRESLASTRPPT